MIKAQEIRKIHEGKFLTYYEIDYLNLDGDVKTYEMVSKNRNLTLDDIGKVEQAVVLIILSEDHSRILISKEFRMGVNQFVLNPVAGLIDEGETAFEAARREAFEETGLTVTHIIDVLPPSFPCAPVTDDMSSVYVCEADGEIRMSDSPNEWIIANWYTKEEVAKMLHDPNVAWAARLQAFCYLWSKN